MGDAIRELRSWFSHLPNKTKLAEFLLKTALTIHLSADCKTAPLFEDLNYFIIYPQSSRIPLLQSEFPSKLLFQRKY